MRPRSDYELVKHLIDRGLNDSQVSRETGIPFTTVNRWRSRGRPGAELSPCHICERLPLPASYSYMLGMYLGDGCLIETKPGLFRLEVALDAAYPGIVIAARTAIESFRPGHPVRLIDRRTYFILSSHWSHWPCIFPQHGEGPKHLRKVALQPWQVSLVTSDVKGFMAGLIHSDGCRSINRVRRTWGGTQRDYAYPRYQFTNHSSDIRALFCWACDLLGVEWRQMNWKTISVARRGSVTSLERFIGPKG